MEFSLSIELLGLLFVTAIIAGLLDTLAGGGGLITIPALILSGMPPLATLATNKLQGTAGSSTASFMMLKHKRVAWQDVKWLMLAAFIGSALGTIAVQFINVDALAIIIPVILLVIAMYFLFAGKPKRHSARISERIYRNLVIPAIGSYDGMFGPGTGSFLAMAGVSLKGQSLLGATAAAKTMNFATNIASLLVFIIAGQVVWLVGGVMMAGQLIGAWLGAHTLFRINPNYLRLIIVAMCLGMLARYAAQMGWV